MGALAPHKYHFLIGRDAELLQKVLGIFVLGGLRAAVPGGQGPGGQGPPAWFGRRDPEIHNGLAANTHLHGIFLQRMHRPVADEPPVFSGSPGKNAGAGGAGGDGIKRRVEKLLVREGKMPGEGADPKSRSRRCGTSCARRRCRGALPWGQRRGGESGAWAVTPCCCRRGSATCAPTPTASTCMPTPAWEQEHKDEKERLCRYILRPGAVRQAPLHCASPGDVVFHLKRAWSKRVDEPSFAHGIH